MKNVFYGEFKGLKDYSPCVRHVDGTLVDPAAYRRWLMEIYAEQ